MKKAIYFVFGFFLYIYAMHFEVASKQRIGNEIATRAEAEIYFRSEDSNGIEDSLINGLVTLARETMEKAINRSLVSHEVVCYASDWKGFLPYGPIDPESIDSDNIITVQGNSYPYVIVGEDQTQITYETECYIGEGLKNAVLELAAYFYERGDYEGASIPPKLKPIIALHKLRFSF
jgi:hypothetical protein